ncbi:MAG: hypothetical protein ACR2OC_08350 [Solirubrobacterales bacterium]
MKNAPRILPFVIAVALPPAGIIIGLLQMTQEDRELGVRLVAISLLALAVWLFLLVG